MKKLLPILAFIAMMAAPALANAGERQQKVLVIYYSLSGITKGVAEQLQRMTGGDIYEIQTVKTYPSRQPGLYNEPKRELEEHDLPALRTPPPDMSGYDLILVGGPVWWYTVSTPLMKFLEEADFGGKKVAGFCTYASTLGQYLPHFSQQARNAQVLDGLDLSYPRNLPPQELENRLRAWLGRVMNG